MSRPTIAVCLSSYNHESYVGHTIRSILEQTFQDFEIIASDDNSKDLTAQVIKDFNNPKITLIENKNNSGPSISMNKALKRANSDFIALIASDDMMEKTRLEKQLKFLKDHPNYSAVFTYAQTIDEQNVEIKNNFMKVFNKSFDSRDKILNYFFYQGNFLCAPSVLIKRNTLEKFSNFTPSLWQLQDFDLWVKILASGEEIGFIEEKLTKYRIGNNLSNISQKPNVGFFSRMSFEVGKVLHNFLLIKNIEDFGKIFPEIKNKYSSLSEKFIPFYLAKEIHEALLDDTSWLRRKSVIDVSGYYNFACDIFYDIFNDDLRREEIEREFDFKMKNFLDLISRNPFVIEINSHNLFSTKKSFVQKLENSIKKRVKNLKK
jgi:glycosyltransferase involved in cell wall biosynthesis